MVLATERCPPKAKQNTNVPANSCRAERSGMQITAATQAMRTKNGQMHDLLCNRCHTHSRRSRNGLFANLNFAFAELSSCLSRRGYARLPETKRFFHEPIANLSLICMQCSFYINPLHKPSDPRSFVCLILTRCETEVISSSQTIPQAAEKETGDADISDARR